MCLELESAVLIVVIKIPLHYLGSLLVGANSVGHHPKTKFSQPGGLVEARLELILHTADIDASADPMVGCTYQSKSVASPIISKNYMTHSLCNLP